MWKQWCPVRDLQKQAFRKWLSYKDHSLISRLFQWCVTHLMGYWEVTKIRRLENIESRDSYGMFPWRDYPDFSFSASWQPWGKQLFLPLHLPLLVLFHYSPQTRVKWLWTEISKTMQKKYKLHIFFRYFVIALEIWLPIFSQTQKQFLNIISSQYSSWELRTTSKKSTEFCCLGI